MTGISDVKELKKILAPSILAADFSCLADQSRLVLRGGAQWLHIDVMDGHFVPNLSMGAPIVESLKKHIFAFFDVHMMVSNPEKWIKLFANAGTSQYTFHFEAVENNSAKAIQLAKEVIDGGMRAGLSLKPKTPIESVYSALDSGLFSVLLIMTVEPGFGGQSFMAEMMEKVTLSRKRYPNIDIEVDGGLNEDTAKIAILSGANVVVAGTSIFKSSNISAATANMLQLMNDHSADGIS